MLSGKTTILLTILICIYCASCFAKDNQEKYLTRVLDSSLEAAHGGNPKIIDVLAKSVRDSENPIDLYISLLDYYLGAGAGETLENYIVEKGNDILPVLLKKMDTPLNCRKEYLEICTDSIESRNEKIARLIKEIQSVSGN